LNNNLKISVVIVNYNVAYFLEQCLNSVFSALKNVPGEVFVVDNDSIDASVDMVREKFPQVKLIANKDNVGFSRANNQAIREARGEYVLLLNPDTVVEEDTFIRCVEFMDEHPDAGGLGVRMIDGKGAFLPESKRGLPTPSVAFYKIFGISRLFPKSKKFGQYHLGYLDELEVNEVDVLSGAFMLMRKKALDEVGLLDEAFFMYGEDIDLSYRIQKGGYKNYYFPKTQIIHYKGESTKKSSVNYVFVFYRAMIIFAEKHFSQKNAKLFSFLINCAIYFRASLALFSRFVQRAFLPIIDFGILLIFLLSLTQLWRKENIFFPEEIMHFAIPSYVAVWQFFIFYFGGYDRPIKLLSFLKGGVIGTLFLLAAYALLPKEYQFSRLFVLMGMVVLLSYYLISRIGLSSILKGRFSLQGTLQKRFAIVGDSEEVERVKKILYAAKNDVESTYWIHPSNNEIEGVIGRLDQLDQIIHIYKVDEVIFCAKNVSAEAIIRWMSTISNDTTEFKIAQPDSLYLIGSNSVDTAGDLYVLEIDNISKPVKRRDKRLFDIAISFFLLLLSPILIWIFQKKLQFIKNCSGVLFGRYTLIGYFSEGEIKKLPKIKPGILYPDLNFTQETNNEHKYKFNLIYARNYSVLQDFRFLSKNFKHLDRN
jgi:GT2 family glycosyltransferase